MAFHSGSNLSDIKSQNRALILKLISTEPLVSRSDLSRITGLTKTTASNIVSDLIEENIICEQTSNPTDTIGNVGRKPIFLDISKKAPCICGMLIKRGLCTAVLADFKGHIFARKDYEYNTNITSDELISILLQLFQHLKLNSNRKILAIGISSIGPVDIVTQEIVNPPNFYGIKNLPLSDIISKSTSLPAYIINDANAGALAEKIYGKVKNIENFIYLHIMNGIGAGYILQDKIYNGDVGQCGEIGHTSINFAGPVCDCGNTGCLELYANLKNMNQKIINLKKVYKKPSILSEGQSQYTWKQIIEAANASDFFATAALDEFCDYLSYALANAINLLDINHIIVGYDSKSNEDTIENMLSAKLNSSVLAAKNRNVIVTKSQFNGNAPLIGSIALITDKIFNCEISI